MTLPIHMILHLTGTDERLMKYCKPFEGRFIDTMPALLAQSYQPASVAVIVDRRENGPEEVRHAWKLNPLYTGDSSATNQAGAVILTLDSPLLRTLDSQSTLLKPMQGFSLLNGGYKATPGEWQGLKNSQESLFLTSEDVEQADGRGYVLKDGEFVPANKTVAKVWDFLNRGNDVKSYAQMIYDASGGSEEHIMCLSFDRSNPQDITVRSVLIKDAYAGNSDVYVAHIGLDGYNLILIGVASEITARQRQ